MKNNTQNQKRWIDISQPLTSSIAHWPEDTPFSYDVSYTKEQTGSVNIGKITTSVHIGTHIDAPFHFKNDGAKVGELDINVYIGPCRIIDVSNASKIDADTLSQYDLEGVTRLLLKTSVPNNPSAFPNEIPYITKSGAEYMQQKGIILLGVDVPSVDPLDSKELEGHHALHEHGIHILENVMLDQIEPGDYELIALPLAIIESDGSPVRAVIRPI
ncbi:arylformamidase [Alkalihalobacterium chitinilyticum]|uniref:Kynurenine formamidase n=1 Tax=Alkalihalobacterium chitinilyticum TaxID=2980103 RepID=A0ABT5VIV7_9BACI|nr:arylformamidase [Alkalihalobacterium chitinilyticum]MDE5415111.1 arylformamidase [Alkalihalobacterium chitinilyticum]